MGIVTVNIDGIVKNYQQIQQIVGSECVVSAVVKANAYGCGIAPVGAALYDAGVREFFVATLPEALELRTIIDDDAAVFMMNGFDAEYGDLYVQENIVPVLNSAPEIESYNALCRQHEQALQAVLHLDTGMNRLGLEASELEWLQNAPDKLEPINLRYVMSHFACSDEKEHPMNEAQCEAFKVASAFLRHTKKSLCNSSGVFRSNKYHFDMVRPGMALYGLNPTPEAQSPMQQVISLDAPVLQIKTAKKGETAGYGATHRFEKDSRFAIIPIGYADGFLRSLSNNGSLFWKNYKCSVRGRVSMDLTIVDLSAVPENELPQPGDRMEVIGQNQSADDLAKRCDTIGYEILTSLSRRYKRVYKS